MEVWLPESWFARGRVNVLEMDKGCSEKVTFTIGENFSSFSVLKEKVDAFEKMNFVQLYIRCSRSIEAAAKHAPKKHLMENFSILKLNTIVFMAERYLKALAQVKDQTKSKPL